MRRAITAVVLAVSLATALLPAGGATADPGIDTLDTAWADWAVATDKPNHFKWYFAMYFKWSRMGDDGRPFVALGTGTCVRKATKHAQTVRCGGRAKPLEPKSWTYSTDAALTEADLVVRQNGRHTVHWTPRNPVPSIFTVESVCANGTGHGGGLYRNTRARGHLYGKRFKPQRWFDISFLMSGMIASTCPGYVDLAERLQAGERITITRTI